MVYMLGISYMVVIVDKCNLVDKYCGCFGQVGHGGHGDDDNWTQASTY